MANDLCVHNTAFALNLARHIAVEVSYEGTYCVDEALADSDLLEKHFGAMGGWVCSTLVRLGDLKLDYLPADGD